MASYSLADLQTSPAPLGEQQHHSIRREVGHLPRRAPRIGLPLILLRAPPARAAGLPRRRAAVCRRGHPGTPTPAWHEPVGPALMLTGWQSTALDATTSATTAAGCTNCRRCSACSVAPPSTMPQHPAATLRLKPDALACSSRPAVRDPSCPACAPGPARPDLSTSAPALFHGRGSTIRCADLHRPSTPHSPARRRPAVWDALASPARARTLDQTWLRRRAATSHAPARHAGAGAPSHQARLPGQRPSARPPRRPLPAGARNPAAPAPPTVCAASLAGCSHPRPLAAHAAPPARLPPRHKLLFPPQADTRNLTTG